MQHYPIAAQDVIIVLSKQAVLSPKSSFYKQLSANSGVIKIAPAYSCGVLCGRGDDTVLKLLSSTPKNIYKQLKNNNIYVK